MNGGDGFYYLVKKNDSLSKIAKRYGVKNWRTIYNHEKNKEFRESHPNPNLIYPGDRIWVPDSSPNRIAVSRDKKTRVIRVARPAIQKIKLGEDELSKCKIDNPRNTIGAIYVPTKWGGYLSLTYPKARNVKLFYKNGVFPTEGDMASLIKEFKTGSHEIAWEMRFQDSVFYTIKPDNKGWYFFTVDGTDAISVKNEFSEENTLSKEPWNSWWWPADDGINPNMFDEKVNYGSGEEEGPLKKYDKYAGTEAPAVSAWKDEWDNWRMAPGTGNAAGMCDATTMAGFEIDRPQGSKNLKAADRSTVTFREQDRLGLAAERYWIGLYRDSKVDPPGNPCQLFLRKGADLEAKWFHSQLRKRIVEEKKGLIVYVGATAAHAGWNSGIYKYNAKFVAYGTGDTEIKKVKIRNELFYKKWEKWEGQEGSYFTVYDLEYSDDGTIFKEINWSPSDPSENIEKPTRVHYSKSKPDPSCLCNKKLRSQTSMNNLDTIIGK